MSEKIFIVGTLARQVLGELVAFRVEKVYRDRESAEKFLEGLSKSEKLTLEGVECSVVRSVFESELE